MQSKDAEHALRKILGPELQSLTPRRAVQAILAFYRDVRADDCELDEDGDMLLVQWGINDWGEGEHFSFDMTRQFIVGPGEDEDIRQLGVTFRYPPEDSLAALGSGNRWCHRPEHVDGFREFIEASEPFRAIADRRAATVDLRYESAG